MFELQKFKISGNILPQGVRAVGLFLEFAKMPDFLLPQWHYNCLSQWPPPLALWEPSLPPKSCHYISQAPTQIGPLFIVIFLLLIEKEELLLS